jgi:hypothetical protein
VESKLPNQENVNLLWTGGWDSTFHLLQLLITHRSIVTPFYLMDEYRPSTSFEIRTIRQIKKRLFNDYPYTQELLKPTQYLAVGDVEPDPEITQAYKAIIGEKRLGKQYEWLARFCKQNSILDMQLCIHRDDKAHLVLEPYVSEDHTGAYPLFRLDETYKLQQEYCLFRFFAFPVFNLTKLQMADSAKEQGWKEIMAMTWFCHTPRRDKKPCGHCNPCIYTIEEGLGWRIPFTGRITYVIQTRLAMPARRIAKRLRGYEVSTRSTGNAS